MKAAAAAWLFSSRVSEERPLPPEAEKSAQAQRMERATAATTVAGMGVQSATRKASEGSLAVRTGGLLLPFVSPSFAPAVPRLSRLEWVDEREREEGKERERKGNGCFAGHTSKPPRIQGTLAFPILSHDVRDRAQHALVHPAFRAFFPA